MRHVNTCQKTLWYSSPILQYILKFTVCNSNSGMSVVSVALATVSMQLSELSTSLLCFSSSLKWVKMKKMIAWVCVCRSGIHVLLKYLILLGATIFVSSLKNCPKRWVFSLSRWRIACYYISQNSRLVLPLANKDSDVEQALNLLCVHILITQQEGAFVMLVILAGTKVLTKLNVYN